VVGQARSISTTFFFSQKGGHCAAKWEGGTGPARRCNLTKTNNNSNNDNDNALEDQSQLLARYVEWTDLGQEVVGASVRPKPADFNSAASHDDEHVWPVQLHATISLVENKPRICELLWGKHGLHPKGLQATHRSLPFSFSFRKQQ
jgi:hypothetical protein